MLALLRQLAPLTSLAAVAAAVAIPATFGLASETLAAQPLAAELVPAAILPATAQTVDAASFRLRAEPDPALLADDDITFSDDDDDGFAPAGDTRAAALDEDTTCLAKAVRHEAGSQSRDGQLAVAQLIVNRRNSGRFADTLCGVVNQQGQFFRTAGYNPDRGTAAWATAVAVSREALAGASRDVAPGALFFHAAYQTPTTFFRTRERVALLGGNIFYR